MGILEDSVSLLPETNPIKLQNAQTQDSHCALHDCFAKVGGVQRWVRDRGREKSWVAEIKWSSQIVKHSVPCSPVVKWGGRPMMPERSARNCAWCDPKLLVLYERQSKTQLKPDNFPRRKTIPWWFRASAHSLYA